MTRRTASPRQTCVDDPDANLQTLDRPLQPAEGVGVELTIRHRHALFRSTDERADRSCVLQLTSRPVTKFRHEGSIPIVL